MCKFRNILIRFIQATNFTRNKRGTIPLRSGVKFHSGTGRQNGKQFTDQGWTQ